MLIKQVTPPAYSPVSLDEVKLHCRIDGSDEDALLPAYMSAAVGACQHLMGRSIMEQTWRVTLDAWEDSIRLPNPEILSITSITYRDADGTTQTLDPSLYELVGDTLHATGDFPELGEGAGLVKIEYKAGYASGNEATQQAAVPANIKAWLLLTVGTMYAQRESIQAGVSLSELPGRFADSLLDAHRVYG